MISTRFVTSIDALAGKWERKGILNQQGATDSEVAAFEQRHSIVLPADIRFYFQRLNGTLAGRYGMEDDDLFGFWHLDQVYPLGEEAWGQESRGPAPEHLAHDSFIFADHSIAVFVLAVQLSKDPNSPTPVLVSHGGPTRVVTTTFAEFVDRYVAGDKAVIYP